MTFSRSNVQPSYAITNGGTAPPILLAWLATISLQLGYRIVQLVQSVLLVQLDQIVRQNFRSSWPPLEAGPGAKTGRSTNHGFTLPLIPSPCRLARLHPNLP
jgi:hypothetical protein